jgi:hypothetical protein
LPFTVERWSEGFDRLEDTIVRAGDLLSAKAVFEDLTKRLPGDWLMVRQGARVVLKSRG